jgi:ATP-dependent Clp protease adaptor protein ClpS
MTTEIADVENNVEDDVKVEEFSKTERPKMGTVRVLNDNTTPFQWVVGVLVDIFGKSSEESERIMMEAHYSGSSVVDTYPMDVAETKVSQGTEWMLQIHAMHNIESNFKFDIQAS